MSKRNAALEAEMTGVQPDKPKKKKKKAVFSWMRLLRRLLLLLVTLALMAVGAATLFLYTVYHGPSPIARDCLTSVLLEDDRTDWIPGLFLDNAQED